jgi:mRNA-degrading endonuclease toxin of MazEF toxin-antitoxin module
MDFHARRTPYNGCTILAMNNKAKSTKTSPATAQSLKTLASEAMKRPSQLNAEQVRKLGAEVMRHIEPRKGGKI